MSKEFYHNLSKGPLSEGFMEEYKDVLDWKVLCTYQILSEKFLRKNIRYIMHYDCWYELSMYQKLNPNFILDFHKYLDMEIVYIHHDVDKEVKDKLKTEYDFLDY